MSIFLNNLNYCKIWRPTNSVLEAVGANSDEHLHFFLYVLIRRYGTKCINFIHNVFKIFCKWLCNHKTIVNESVKLFGKECLFFIKTLLLY